LRQEIYPQYCRVRRSNFKKWLKIEGF